MYLSERNRKYDFVSQINVCYALISIYQSLKLIFYNSLFYVKIFLLISLDQLYQI